MGSTCSSTMSAARSSTRSSLGSTSTRASCCAARSQNPTPPRRSPANYSNLVARRAHMEGFTGLDYPTRIPEAFEALGHWQREGRLLQKEDVVFGFENA